MISLNTEKTEKKGVFQKMENSFFIINRLSIKLQL